MVEAAHGWRGGSCNEAYGGEACGGQGERSEEKEDEAAGRGKGLLGDWLLPARHGPIEEVLNPLSTFVPRPGQGGWEGREG